MGYCTDEHKRTRSTRSIRAIPILEGEMKVFLQCLHKNHGDRPHRGWREKHVAIGVGYISYEKFDVSID